ncbi:sensor histidine kinase [Bacillus clarus]|uniref:histidine kinase n=1 Tax=Bacillus clarus TaxID=2338372 RepID=A0A090Z4X3_9BACI|nr:sensor histidine kinase [Bacillus clarus]KFM99435.1 histidine kinase family protein [Bacillus clarus]RFT64392.1 sensor histidine kinase [Bacillus clarus]
MLKKLYPHDQIEKYLLLDVIFLVFLFYNMLRAETSISLYWKLFFLTLILISFYLKLWFKDWRLLTSSLFSCALFTILAISIDIWLLSYGFIIGNLLGRAHSKIYIAIGTIGIIIMFLLVSYQIYGHSFTILKTSFLPIIILQITQPLIIHIREKSKLLQKALNTANSQIERYIQEEERNRIARDLHDTLGQTLTMIKLKSELSIRLIEKDTPQAKRELNDILDTSRYALKQVRELVTDMKYISLKDELEHINQLLYTSSIQLVIKGNADHLTLSNIAETMVALSIREAITNVLRHSKATRCTINIKKDADFYTLTINDDGIGFQQHSYGFGIQSITERMKILQGTVQIHTQKNNGTTITLKFPIPLEQTK